MDVRVIFSQGGDGLVYLPEHEVYVEKTDNGYTLLQPLDSAVVEEDEKTAITAALSAETGVAGAVDRVTARKMASGPCAPERKNINPEILYQVTVDGRPTTGPGFSSEAWRTEDDAEGAAEAKRAYLAHTWGSDAPAVKVQSTTQPVQIVKEWADIDSRSYRRYGRCGNGYSYIGISQ